jgi:hypothetical protein
MVFNNIIWYYYLGERSKDRFSPPIKLYRGGGDSAD